MSKATGANSTIDRRGDSGGDLAHTCEPPWCVGVLAKHTAQSSGEAHGLYVVCWGLGLRYPVPYQKLAIVSLTPHPSPVRDQLVHYRPHPMCVLMGIPPTFHVSPAPASARRRHAGGVLPRTYPTRQDGGSLIYFWPGLGDQSKPFL